MCAPKPPPPPNFAAAAAAQGAANKEAAIASAILNNPNVISPHGNQVVTYSNPKQPTNPAGAPTLNQAAYNAALQQYQQKLAAFNSTPSHALVNQNPLAGPFSTARFQEVNRGAPPVAPNPADFISSGANGITQTLNPAEQEILNRSLQPTITQTLPPAEQVILDKSRQAQTNLADLSIQASQALQGVVGKPLDLSGAPKIGSGEDVRKRVIDAAMARINEDYTIQKDQANSELIARGIQPHNKAYADEIALLQRGRNDAFNQAQISGGNAAAQQQALDVTARNNYISSLLAQRQTPLNEISSLLSGSQVSNPFTIPGAVQNTNIVPAPVFAGTEASYQGQLNNYNAQAGAYGNNLSGLFGLGGAALLSPVGTFRRRAVA